MRFRLAVACLGAFGGLALPTLARAADDASPAPRPVLAGITTTLKTAGDALRTQAFDANAQTAFVSDAPPKAGDHFTLRFESPVELGKIRVHALRADGSDALDGAHLLVSGDDGVFVRAAIFQKGFADASLDKTPIRAIRVQPVADLSHALVLNEIEVESNPPVAAFRTPVEFVVDSTDAPDLAEWLERVRVVCEQQYSMIAEELKSDGYSPPRVVRLKLSKDYDGVAAASGDRIVGSVKYFRDHRDDVGAFVHEAAHVVQNYRRRGTPGWLVEGIADYVRFVKYEPQNIGRINPDRARYDGSYRTSAAFLGYVAKTYDAELVRKLNEACRQGEYRDELFEQHTRKKLADLDAEWRESLRRK